MQAELWDICHFPEAGLKGPPPRLDLFYQCLSVLISGYPCSESAMNIVVTGSSTGIGRALAERLLARGHQLWGLARSDQTDFAAQHEGRFRFSRCDVSKWLEVEQAARDVAQTWSHVDGLIACAGVQGEVGRALSADPARWSETVRANLEGTFYAVRGFDELLACTRARAKVICFSGGGATKPRVRFSA